MSSLLRCAAALTLDGDPRATVAATAARLRSALEGARPDVLLAFSTLHHRSAFPEIIRMLHQELDPRVFLGCTGEGLIGEAAEVERRSALSLFAATLPGTTVRPFHLTFDPADEGGAVSGFPLDDARQCAQDGAVLLLPDPFTFPADEFLRSLNEEAPGLRVFGGMASGGQLPGQHRLFRGDQLLEEGAVGCLLSGGVRLRTVVSQGCRPIGRHFVVTKADGNVIQELGGRPALERLGELFQSLPEGEQDLARRALHVGRVADEHQVEFRRGDFLVRNVLGVDRESGGLEIADHVRRGQTIQFHVRDADTAREDLRLLLQEQAGWLRDHPARGALLFSCNGRGSRFFTDPHHDVTCVRDGVGDVPVAGFFAAGELGPVGTRNFLHGFTASIVLLCEP